MTDVEIQVVHWIKRLEMVVVVMPLSIMHAAAALRELADSEMVVVVMPLSIMHAAAALRELADSEGGFGDGTPLAPFLLVLSAGAICSAGGFGDATPLAPFQLVLAAGAICSAVLTGTQMESFRFWEDPSHPRMRPLEMESFRFWEDPSHPRMRPLE
ncbi:hypothetical protein T484DRAFT_1813688, partial [Baffinella frigidus]